MRSMNYGPTARQDESKNWIFTTELLEAYKNNLPGVAGAKRFHDPTADEEPGVKPGVEFQFTNGPYGGGRKFVVVVVGEFEIDGVLTEAVIAREK